MLLKNCQSTIPMTGHSWIQPNTVSYKILENIKTQKNYASIFTHA